MASVGRYASATNPGIGGTTHPITFPGALTNHSILVGILRTGTATTLLSVGDGTQTWTVGTHRDQVGRTYIAYFVNNGLTSTPTVTFTITPGGSPRVAIFEIIPDDLSGSNTSFMTYGQTTGVDGNSAASGTAADGGTTGTLSHNNAISVGVIAAGADESYSAGTGYTLIGGGSGTDRTGAVYRIVTATSPVQALITLSVSAEWNCITAVFQLQADGGGSPAYSDAAASKIGLHGTSTGSQSSPTSATGNAAGHAGLHGQCLGVRNIWGFAVGGLGPQGQSAKFTPGSATDPAQGHAGLKGTVLTGTTTRTVLAAAGHAGLHGASAGTQGAVHTGTAVSRSGMRGVATGVQGAPPAILHVVWNVNHFELAAP